MTVLVDGVLALMCHILQVVQNLMVVVVGSEHLVEVLVVGSKGSRVDLDHMRVLVDVPRDVVKLFCDLVHLVFKCLKCDHKVRLRLDPNLVGLLVKHVFLRVEV